MVRWCNTVVLLVLAVAVVRTMTVECNYSIASGGGKAATSEIKGNKQDAKEKVHQTLEEANETAVTWTDWAKDKIQGVLGLVGFANGGIKIDKAAEIVDEASGKAKGKYEQVKEKTYEVIDEEL
ncbi:hypothetical protein SOVF_056330 [Spinacia oleracea]|uniref:Uncharacterized protein n=1 Tax=Spinacia oleracea TaxID=3562 RepID=A0A9R0IRG9_SPIOL|nr:uncharacterized protein LOC110792409 [Spinacia oleracea]KNA19995.1 hypothetical protein SOVF_056330 [Spinacia oleracea]